MKKAAVLVCLIALIACGGGEKTAMAPAYTAQQIKTAEEYIKLLTDSGLVKEYKGEGGSLIAYVDRRTWNIGTFENKKTILKTLSQANETRGNTPWIEIRDLRSGKVYGEVSRSTFKVYE